MEPRHWSEDGATEIEKMLLRAGRDDGPQKGADLRLLAMLQQPSPPVVKPTTLTRWTKIGLLAVVAGGAAVLTHQLSRPYAAPPMSAAPAPESAEARASRNVPARAEVRGNPEIAREEQAAPLPREGDAQGRRTAREASRPAKPAGVANDHSLGEETRSLDRAREALDTHRSAAALRLLDEHRHRFPQGRLRPEAMILRLDALVQAGRFQAADSLANQLLADKAYGPYVPRIQSLLRDVKP
jgi:hypothetical protein